MTSTKVQQPGGTLYILSVARADATYKHTIFAGKSERRDTTAFRLRRARKVLRSWAAGDRR